jgi:KTSC domain
MSELEWIDVPDSARVSAIAYDEEAEVIYVRFTNGDLEWCYEECPPHVWDEFSNPSQSKGQYIHQVLNHKPHHRHD